MAQPDLQANASAGPAPAPGLPTQPRAGARTRPDAGPAPGVGNGTGTGTKKTRAGVKKAEAIPDEPGAGALPPAPDHPGSEPGAGARTRTGTKARARAGTKARAGTRARAKAGAEAKAAPDEFGAKVKAEAEAEAEAKAKAKAGAGAEAGAAPDGFGAGAIPPAPARPGTRADRRAKGDPGAGADRRAGAESSAGADRKARAEPGAGDGRGAGVDRKGKARSARTVPVTASAGVPAAETTDPETAATGTSATETATTGTSATGEAAPGATAPEAKLTWPHVPMRWPEQERYSQPWMVTWLEAAASSLSVVEACERAEIGLAQYLLGRQTDHAFDRAALIFDQIVDLMIREQVRRRALHGDPTMTRMYLTMVAGPPVRVAFPSWSRQPRPVPPESEQLPPHVADAMIAAGLKALERGPDPDEPDDPDG